MTEKKLLFLCFFAGIFLFISCGKVLGTADTSHFGDAGNLPEDTAVDTEPEFSIDGGIGVPGGPGAQLAGIWGQLVVSSHYQLNVPILNDLWTSVRSWYIVKLTNDGNGNITATEKLCMLKYHVENKSNSINAIDVPRVVVDNAPVNERHVSYLTSSSPGTTWESDNIYEVWGASLCEPYKSDMPVGGIDVDIAPTCDAPCFDSQCDMDKDGYAGITLRTRGVLSGVVDCDTYVSQRRTTSFNGKIIDKNTIGGNLGKRKFEQVVLGGSNSICSSDISIHYDFCKDRHYFKMVRLPDDANCVDVLKLTDCDEDEDSCETNTNLSLDPISQNGDSCQ